MKPRALVALVAWLVVFPASPALPKTPVDDAALDQLTASGEGEPAQDSADAAAAYTDPLTIYTGKPGLEPPATPPRPTPFPLDLPTNYFDPRISPGTRPTSIAPVPIRP